MRDENKTKKQLVAELQELRQRLAEVDKNKADRKITEESLRLSEALYRELVQNANSVIIRWSRDGTITFLNQYAQEFFGWHGDEAIGKHVHILIPDRESTGSDLTRLAQHIVDHPEHYVNNMNENVRRDGSRVWMNWTNRAILDESGQVTEILAIGNDVTERQLAEEALRKSEQKHRELALAIEAERGKLEAIIDSLPVGLWIADVTGKIVLINDHARTIWGGTVPVAGSVQDYEAYKCWREDTEDPISVQDRCMTRSLRGETCKNVVVDFDRFDGARGTQLISSAPIKTSDGTVTGGIAIVQDITERKQLEEALRESEKRLAADLDAMTKLQKIGTLFVREDSLEPVLGKIVEAAIGISGADFGNIQLVDPKSSQLQVLAQRGFSEEILDSWSGVAEGWGACGTAFERGERIIVENVEHSPIFIGTSALEIQLKAGVRAVQSTPLLSWSGKLLGMFSTHYKKPHRPDDRELRLLDLLARMATDIIERAQTGEALKKSESELRFLSAKLFSAQEDERKRIAAELHDDLGGALCAIKMSLVNARNRLEQGEAKPELLESAIAWVHQMIDQVRLLSELRPCLLDHMGVIAAIDGFMAQYRASYPEIHVEEEILLAEADVPEALRTVIFRIMQEAFSNIAKYSRAEFARLSLVKNGRTIELAIEDGGQGFDLEATLSRRRDQRGLGLTSMRERCLLSGGVFQMDSIIGKGTVVRASWPIDKPA